MDGRDPYLYDVELIRQRKLEQLELYPEMGYPPLPEKETDAPVFGRKTETRMARIRSIRKRRKHP